MLRRLRSGKRSARSGYNDVNEQGSHQHNDLYNTAAHKQQNNRSTYPASPPRRSVNSQKKPSSSPPKSPRQEQHSRHRPDRLARDHTSKPQRNKTQPVVFDSPDDDVSRGFTSLTYESSVTGASNASKSRNADNSVSFSTIWEREEADFEHTSDAVDSTPMQVAEARRSALHIARYDRTTNSMQRNNSYRLNPAKQRIKSSGYATTQQQTPPINTPEISRRHDYDYQPSPPQQRKATNNAQNSSKGNDTIIKVRLPSPEMEKKEVSPPPSFIASSAQTQNVNNGTNHMISRLLKKHQYQAERSKERDKKSTMEPLQQADLAPATATNNARNHQITEAARNRKASSGQKPDPASKSNSAVSSRHNIRPPDPPAEEWKRPIPVKKVTSTYSRHSASSSKFWDEVEKFPAIKGERELQQFFKQKQNLVQVTKEPVDLE